MVLPRNLIGSRLRPTVQDMFASHVFELSGSRTRSAVIRKYVQVLRPTIICASAALILASGCFGWFYWPRSISLPSYDMLMRASVAQSGAVRVWIPGSALTGELGAYEDAVYGFLMFDFLRSRPQLRGSEVLLRYAGPDEPRPYRVELLCPNNLLPCVARLAELHAGALSAGVDWAFLPAQALADVRRQTTLFTQAYNKPVGQRFHKLSTSERAGYIRRFIRFKSATDRRVRTGAAGLQALTKDEATELASDMIVVANFYDLPLDLLLGIGAMENNYLNARGDLNHAVWKRRPQEGDIVLRRRRGRVLVRNFSLGVWQITRETLRFAHSLYLADKRDYSKLPERLRPGRTLDLDRVQPGALTTYAGLLLRYLLDHFHGDVAKATAAYNGGIARPNPEYEAQVRQIVEYARRILGRAAALENAAILAR